MPLEAGARLLPWGALCLSVLTLWYGSQFVKIALASRWQAAELKEIQLRAEPVISAKENAIAARDRIGALQAILDRFPGQLEVLAAVAGILPAEGAAIREWEYTSGRLRIQLSSTGKSGSKDFVKFFQTTGMFRNVEAVPMNDGSGFNMTMEIVASDKLRLARAEPAGRK